MSVYLTKKTTLGQAVFNLFAYTMLGLMALTSLLPFIYLLSLSLSSNIAVQAGKVGLLPVGFTLENYGYIAKEASYFRAFWVSVERVALGASLNMLMAILVAYPLSKPSTRFTSRKYYAWFFAFTMFFSGGMIPTYLVVRYTGLTDTIWALVIPGAVNVWNTIMLMRFFTEVPPELEEAAIVDGAGHASIIFNVYLPLSLPALATILLLVTVGHWNEWFSAVLYMNKPEHYPLQTYLSVIVRESTMMDATKLANMTDEQLKLMQNIGEKPLRSAQIFLGALPILLVYPFMQRFFVKGIAVGSVKG